MLVRYRKDYQKIAMGLLSLLPELRTGNRFVEELTWATKQNREIYLWKDQEDNHFIAVIILEVKADCVIVRRLSFTPSERSGKNVFALLSAVHEEYPGKLLMGTLENQPLITSWRKSHD